MLQNDVGGIISSQYNIVLIVMHSFANVADKKKGFLNFKKILYTHLSNFCISHADQFNS